MAKLIWVLDTSSLIQIKSSIARSHRRNVFHALSNLVDAGRLVFPREVLAELKRGAERGSPDEACEWAQRVETKACASGASPADVRAILELVEDILDPAKDSV